MHADAVLSHRDRDPAPHNPHRLRARIKDRRDEARFLVDEIFDLEAQLPYPPSRVCPCCSREIPPSRPRG